MYPSRDRKISSVRSINPEPTATLQFDRMVLMPIIGAPRERGLFFERRARASSCARSRKNWCRGFHPTAITHCQPAAGRNQVRDLSSRYTGERQGAPFLTARCCYASLTAALASVPPLHLRACTSALNDASLGSKLGSRGPIRTGDLQLMRLASYRCSTLLNESRAALRCAFPAYRWAPHGPGTRRFRRSVYAHDEWEEKSQTVPPPGSCGAHLTVKSMRAGKECEERAQDRLEVHAALRGLGGLIVAAWYPAMNLRTRAAVSGHTRLPLRISPINLPSFTARNPKAVSVRETQGRDRNASISSSNESEAIARAR